MDNAKIPRILHYCWFGGNSKPEVIQKCITSWRRYCPDWEIIEWNEENFDVTSIPYMREAYEAKKWAFVSDVARLLIIYQIGGIYLDTDVELLQSIDELLDSNAFFVFETSRNVNTGMGFGAIKEHKTVAAMIDYYKEKHFIMDGVQQLFQCPEGNTEALKITYSEFCRNGMTQSFDKVNILSGKEYSKYAIHHGTATWVEGPKAKQREYHSSKLKSLLRNPKHFEWIENRLGKKAVQIYTWLVYDLQEFGVGFYIKKLFYKLRRK